MDRSFDVTEEIGTGEPLSQTAWIFAPEDAAEVKGAILCLAGGTYDKRYWHPEVPGHDGYSFGRHLAGRGYVVIALDHLGVGGSSDPTASGAVTLQLMARGDAAVAAQIRARLDGGTLVPGLPPLPHLPLIGAGHSMGACLTTMVQAQAGAYDAVVLLGYGVDITNVHDEKATSEALEERVDETEAIFRATTGTAPDATSTIVPRALLRQLFHGPDVPEEVIRVDDAAQSRVPVRAASEVTTPGYVRQYAEAVDVPIFLGFGRVDVSPDPYAEPACYRASADVTLVIVEGSGHCHNFAGRRGELWNRIASWGDAISSRRTAAASSLEGDVR
ncbi:alpha/beta hydrolase [Actinomadura physcomitrii]|uniref:alpha/beta hydrolase n=1 Tax=Actinomadura physcomitrii TaxID=2650748 RepID=UPI00192061A4|nr:alpha/beta hydrolase [Actinomadura physcomitrii]